MFVSYPQGLLGLSIYRKKKEHTNVTLIPSDTLKNPVENLQNRVEADMAKKGWGVGGWEGVAPY